MNRQDLSNKVISIASETLRTKQYVSSFYILSGLGYLSPSVLDDWRRGRFPYLEQQLQVNLSKLSFFMECFRQWATKNGLLSREIAYMQHATTHKIQLRFSKSGDKTIEEHYRTHYISSALIQQKTRRLM
jgi:hypothetical protein